MKKLMLMSLFLLATMTGCNANDTKESAQIQTLDNRNPTLIERRISKNEAYQGQGTRPIERQRFARQETDQDRGQSTLKISQGVPPNFDPNFGRTRTQSGTTKIMNVPNRNAVSNDIAKARNVLRRSGQFEPGEIVVEKDYMWITVYKKERMTTGQQANAESTVYSTLKRQLPDYKLEIRLFEKRT
jgi:hypothetical protein